MKINRFFSGLVGLVLAACGPDDPTCKENCSQDTGIVSTDGGYSDSGLDSGSLDSGYDGGTDGSVDGGNDNLPPVVIIEARDGQGNVKTEFNVGELVTYNLNKSYDPDCEKKNKCEGAGTYLPQCIKGIDYCRRDDSTGSSGLFFPDVDLTVGYGSESLNKTILFHVKCFDLESKGMDESIRPFGENTYNILIK